MMPHPTYDVLVDSHAFALLCNAHIHSVKLMIEDRPVVELGAHCLPELAARVDFDTGRYELMSAEVHFKSYGDVIPAVRFNHSYDEFLSEDEIDTSGEQWLLADDDRKWCPAAKPAATLHGAICNFLATFLSQGPHRQELAAYQFRLVELEAIRAQFGHD